MRQSSPASVASAPLRGNMMMPATPSSPTTASSPDTENWQDTQVNCLVCSGCGLLVPLADVVSMSAHSRWETRQSIARLCARASQRCRHVIEGLISFPQCDVMCAQKYAMQGKAATLILCIEGIKVVDVGSQRIAMAHPTSKARACAHVDPPPDGAQVSMCSADPPNCMFGFVAKNEQNNKFCHVFLMKKPSHADEVCACVCLSTCEQRAGARACGQDLQAGLCATEADGSHQARCEQHMSSSIIIIHATRGSSPRVDQVQSPCWATYPRYGCSGMCDRAYPVCVLQRDDPTAS